MAIKENKAVYDGEKLKVIAGVIRENSSNGRFTKYKDFLEEPISIQEDKVQGAIDALTVAQEYSDIVEMQGKEQKYLYSNKKMTENYAKMVFRVEEKELLSLLAETVRYESKTYPRPTEISFFYGKPFNFNDLQLKDFIDQLSHDAVYSDIQKFKAYDGVTYLYSTKYLSRDYAIALTELSQYQTP